MPRPKRKHDPWLAKYVVLPGALFAGAFMATLYLTNPAVGVGAVTLAALPYATKAKTYGSAALRGIAVGLLGGSCVASALYFRYDGNPTPAYLGITLAVVTCTAAALLFCYLAKRRQAIIDQQWD